MVIDSIPDILKHKANDIDALCKKHRVTYLAVFGSATTGRFRADSDLDFLVTFEGHLSAREKAAAFFGLKQDIEALFDRPVDLVTKASLTNPYFRDSVLAGQRLLYAD
ncbi:nucleotidyltransferase family protein [Marinobacter sp. OP 3.4]|uniref:nucleotidyltransferase family protein n=1 Tax=Marinobacter sp. OP 3.4 TaxID=3076501 RepID=UPI002E1FC6F7